VNEYVQATIVNGTPRPVFRLSEPCTTPLERLGANGWEPVYSWTTCSAWGPTTVEIAPGETETVTVGLVRSPSHDWRTDEEELRVEFDLSDPDGELPLEYRVSEPFRLTLE
jgi:hypothetical protein